MNIFPFLLSVILIRIGAFMFKIRIFRRLWYRQLFTMWFRPYFKRQIWIICCVFGNGGDPCYVCYFSPHQSMVKEKSIWQKYPYNLWEASHYLHKNMRDPIFILVTHFTTKLKFIAFLNKRGKISPLKIESHFITHVT